MAYQPQPMDLNRFYEHWVAFTPVLDAIEPTLLVSQVQALGRQDARLLLREANAVNKKDFGAEELHDRIFESYQWVLTAYEVIRMLWQRSEENPGLLRQESKDLLNRVHACITRLRIPLAKMEPAKRHRDTDFALAYPGESLENGSAAWMVSDGVWISRRAMADLMLHLLQQLTSDGINLASRSPEQEPA